MGVTIFEDGANARKNNRRPDPFDVGNAGAPGDGLNDAYLAFKNVSDTLGTSGSMYVPPGTYRIGTNVTIACGVTFANGASLKPDSGVTVTLAGPVVSATGESIVAGGAAGTVAVTGPSTSSFALAEDLGGRRIVVIAGVLRQNASDPTLWYWIGQTENPNYGLHVPTGVSRIPNTPAGNLVASGTNLTFYYDRDFDRTISVIVTPDESLARAWGVSCGASVGLSTVTINASISRTGTGTIYWDGAAWVSTDGTNQDLNPALAYNNGNLTVTHDYCPGAHVNVQAWTRGGAITPYIPVLRTVSAGSFVVSFIDPATGALVTGAATTNMSFYWNKTYNGPANMNTADVPWSTGNLWVLGVMDAGQ